MEKIHVPFVYFTERENQGETPLSMRGNAAYTKYQRYENYYRIKVPLPGYKRKPEVGVEVLFFLFLPLFLTCIGMIKLWFLVSPQLLERLLGHTATPLALLEGCERWYFLLLAGCGIGIVVMAACNIFLLLRGRSVFSVSLVCFLLYGGITLSMLFIEEVPGLWRQTREDIAQIESGELEQVTVWLSPKVHKDRMPGPYTKGQPEPVSRYGGISWETDGEWVYFYIPDNLNFSLDQTALYQESQSIQWNEEHARQYQLRYTTNLHLVVEVKEV